MTRLRIPLGLALLAALLATTVGRGQPPQPEPKGPPKLDPTEEGYRRFFKKPVTVPQFWEAIQFEIEVGRFDLAALHLRGLLDKKPSDDELFRLEEQVGLAALLKLRNIPKWSDIRDKQKQALADVEELIVRTTAVVQRVLKDPERIKKYVAALTASPEENAFALKELTRSGASVVPFLIDAIRKETNDERRILLDSLRRLGAETVPPTLAALDSNDPRLQQELIEVLVKRYAKEAVPRLWFLSASDAVPDPVRKAARKALSVLLDTEPSKLPQAKVMLTREAERYYKGEVEYLDRTKVPVWRWEKDQVVQGWPAAPTVPASKADEYWGAYYARQALALDKTYQPAQLMLLSLLLSKAAERSGPTQPLAFTEPAVADLLATVNPDLLVSVLERGLKEKKTGIVLGAVQALGALAEKKAARPMAKGDAPLVRALYYGDARVRVAAAEALLRTPGTQTARVAGRIVEILAKAVTGEPLAQGARPKILVAIAEQGWRDQVGRAVSDAGFEPVLVSTGRELFRRLHAAADLDALLIESTLPDPGLTSLLGQLRVDIYAKKLPTLLAAVPEGEGVRDVIERYRNDQRRVRELDVIARPLIQKRDEIEAERAEKLKSVRERYESLKGFTKEEVIKDYELGIKQVNIDYDEMLRKLRERSFREQRAEEDMNRLKAEMAALVNRFTQASRRREEVLAKLVEPERNVVVVSPTALTNGDALKTYLEVSVADGASQSVTPEERREFAEWAIRRLAGLARGEPEGYDVRPAADAILAGLQSTTLSKEGQAAAAAAAGRLPGHRVQTELATVVLSPGRDPQVRAVAAAELVRHLQKNGRTLGTHAVAALKEAYANADPALKPALAQVVGALRPDEPATGDRLLRHPLPAPAAPPPPKP